MLVHEVVPGGPPGHYLRPRVPTGRITSRRAEMLVYEVILGGPPGHYLRPRVPKVEGAKRHKEILLHEGPKCLFMK